MDLTEIGAEGMDLIHATEHTDKHEILVKQ